MLICLSLDFLIVFLSMTNIGSCGAEKDPPETPTKKQMAKADDTGKQVKHLQEQMHMLQTELVRNIYICNFYSIVNFRRRTSKERTRAKKRTVQPMRVMRLRMPSCHMKRQQQEEPVIFTYVYGTLIKCSLLSKMRTTGLVVVVFGQWSLNAFARHFRHMPPIMGTQGNRSMPSYVISKYIKFLYEALKT